MPKPKLCQITLPGLEVRYDWRIVQDRLLDEFPKVNDVLATTLSGTLLIVYEGPAETDAWLETVSETILNYRHNVSRNGTNGRAAARREEARIKRLPLLAKLALLTSAQTPA